MKVWYNESMVYHIAYLVTWWPSWLRESPRYLIPSNECSMISFAFPTRLLCMRSSFWVLSRILGPIPSISAILEKIPINGINQAIHIIKYKNCGISIILPTYLNQIAKLICNYGESRCIMSWRFHPLSHFVNTH